jgi:nicotinamidase/pyrazinamidase
VTDGDAVIDPLNRLLAAWRARRLPVYLSRDWHPPDHCSFAAQGGPWPVHCVADTPGAGFAARLTRAQDDTVISKATRVDRDAYSAFDGTPLAAELDRRDVVRLWIGGLATDYCVRASALDARAAGFHVVVLTDAIRAVNVQPGDGTRAIDEMSAAGCALATTSAVPGAKESGA